MHVQDSEEKKSQPYFSKHFLQVALRHFAEARLTHTLSSEGWGARAHPWHDLDGLGSPFFLTPLLHDFSTPSKDPI